MKASVFIVALVALVCACTAAYEKDRVLNLPIYGQLLSKNYAGYLPMKSGAKPYYWLVESEGNPAKDPLVLWLNGGPGCSSVLGLLEENGPYVMRHGGSFVRNEFRWTKYASIVYIESPPGVGFSRNTKPPTNWTDESTATVNYESLLAFFEKFPEYKGRDFHIGGESYAGHYIPQLAEKILDGPDKVLLKSMKGFMAGNPCTGDIGCGNHDPTLDVYLRNHGFLPLNESVPVGKKARYDPYDILVPTCETEGLMKRVRFAHPVVDALKRKYRDGPPAPYGPCADNYVTAWLRRADVMAAIHADPDVQWVECGGINYDFNIHGVTNLYTRFMNETKWKMMIYSGTADTVVNFIQTQTIVNGLNRTVARPYSPWYYPYVYDSNFTQLAGFYLEFDRITWAGVKGSGHMVPQFQPAEALELFRSFLLLGRPGRLSQ